MEKIQLMGKLGIIYKKIENIAICATCQACIGPRLPNGPKIEHVYI